MGVGVGNLEKIGVGAGNLEKEGGGLGKIGGWGCSDLKKKGVPLREIGFLEARFEKVAMECAEYNVHGSEPPPLPFRGIRGAWGPIPPARKGAAPST